MARGCKLLQTPTLPPDILLFDFPTSYLSIMCESCSRNRPKLGGEGQWDFSSDLHISGQPISSPHRHGQFHTHGIHMNYLFTYPCPHGQVDRLIIQTTPPPPLHPNKTWVKSTPSTGQFWNSPNHFLCFLAPHYYNLDYPFQQHYILGL